MFQDYDVWVVIDPANKDWFKVQAESIQQAAEAAALSPGTVSAKSDLQAHGQ